MSSTLTNQSIVNEQGIYQPAHEPVLSKGFAQKYSFDSPSTIAKHSQFNTSAAYSPLDSNHSGLNNIVGKEFFGLENTGSQSGLPSTPLPPALPQWNSSLRQPRQMRLRTRDWNNKPWSQDIQGQGFLGQQFRDSYYPPASFNNSLTGHNVQSSSLSQHSGLPISNYIPSSTIPRNHDYHLPSSQLAQSTLPSQLPINESYYTPSILSKDYESTLGNSSLNSNNFDNTLGNNHSGLNNIVGKEYFGLNDNGNNHSVLNTIGDNSFNSNIGGNNFNSDIGGNNLSVPPPPRWNTRNNRTWNRGKQMRPLRTRNWGSRTENGWSGFNNNSILNEVFLQNRPVISHAPVNAPPVFGMYNRQRQWRSGPYRMRPLRTRNWGLRSENGWANFNRGIYSNEAALPFMNRTRNFDQFAEQQSFIPTQQMAPISVPPTITSTMAPTIIPTTAPLMSAPVMAPLTRRQAKKQAKRAAIAQRLNAMVNPPIGDPAVNHYRRGAPITVPITGSAPGGLASPVGSKFSSRRRGRRNNLGHRNGRTTVNPLPVPATQPPFVAPVAPTTTTAYPVGATTPLTAGYPAVTYRTVHTNVLPASIYQAQPISTFQPINYSSNGTMSQASIQQRANPLLYSSGAQQVRPLSSTLGDSTVAQSSGLPLYSVNEPVATQILNKSVAPQAPVYSNRLGTASF